MKKLVVCGRDGDLPHTSVDKGMGDFHQLVISKVCRYDMLKLAHDIWSYGSEVDFEATLS